MHKLLNMFDWFTSAALILQIIPCLEAHVWFYPYGVVYFLLRFQQLVFSPLYDLIRVADASAQIIYIF
jgi:hypothetical protein